MVLSLYCYWQWWYSSYRNITPSFANCCLNLDIMNRTGTVLFNIIHLCSIYQLLPLSKGHKFFQKNMQSIYARHINSMNTRKHSILNWTTLQRSTHNSISNCIWAIENLLTSRMFNSRTSPFCLTNSSLIFISMKVNNKNSTSCRYYFVWFGLWMIYSGSTYSARKKRPVQNN